MSAMLKHCMKSVKCKPIASSVAMKSSNSDIRSDFISNEFEKIIDNSSLKPFICDPPTYVEHPGEGIELKRARLLYQSRKRGMLENGLILSTFAKKYLHTFDEHQLKLYDHLINFPSNDWDLFYWAAGVKETPNQFNHEIMDLLKKHVRNDDRQSRILQPDL